MEMDVNKRRTCLFLLLLLLCHMVAVLLFCKGFLLRRVVVQEYSNCSVNPSHGFPEYPSEPVVEHPEDSEVRTSDSDQSCNAYPRRFRRVVWLLVDALRYDFTDYDATLDPVPNYRNKLPFVRDLLRDKPCNTKLFRFVADPPTTTMQRLKALTTGSLPTFIDIGSNFNNYEVTEDNLLNQIRTNGRNVTFIGDDTWLGLYGSLLTRVFDYPSLNVKDLHTVDNGVIDHIGPELERGDADFIVGHFLGVDHVGHTYGPSHWTMADKLSQMNAVLQSIFAAVGNDTIVFVFGDHGMTASGDHGGESEMETTAALLVFTPRPIFHPHQTSGRSLNQIDIVPTVSLLLGVPIPFSNLGMIIPEVFLPWTPGPEENGRQRNEDEPLVVDSEVPMGLGDNGYQGRVTPEFILALEINAKQVEEYLRIYIRHSEDFPSDMYISLQKKLAHAQEMHTLSKAHVTVNQTVLSQVASAYVEYMRDVKMMCHNEWAKFDDKPITLGIVLFTLAVITNVLALLWTDLSVKCFLKYLPFACVLGTLLSLMFLIATAVPIELSVRSLLDIFLSLSLGPLLILLILQIGSVCCQSYFSHIKTLTSVSVILILHQWQFTFILSTVIAVGYSLSLMSNSFTLYEGDMVIFFIQTLLICFVERKLRSNCPINFTGKGMTRKQAVISRSTLSVLWPFLLAMVLVRLTKLFYECRDLQVGCETTSFILPYSRAIEVLGKMADLRLYLTSLGVMCVPVALAAFVMHSSVSQHLSCWLRFCVYFSLPVASVCVFLFWLLQSLPQSTLDSMAHWKHVALPQSVYILCGSTIIVCFVAPLAKSYTESLRSITISDQKENEETVSQYSTHVGGLRRRELSAISTSMVVTNEQNVSSSRMRKHEIYCWSSSVLPLLVLVLLVAVWIPITLLLNDGIALSALLQLVEMALVVSSLSWMEGHSSLDTMWPVVVFWALSSSQLFFGFGHQTTVVSLRFEAGFVGLHGEVFGAKLVLAGLLVGINILSSQIIAGIGLPLLLTLRREKAAIPSRDVLRLGLQYIAFHSIKTLVTMVAASLHRRHLMVWGVFSPRFLYQAAFQATADCCVICVYVFVTRISF